MTTAINEVYFGKTPEVLKIQEAVRKLRRPYMNKYYAKEVMNDPNRYALGDAIAKAFGFSVCDLQIYFSKAPNAYTFPIGDAIDVNLKANLMLNKAKGFKYNPKAGFSCIIYIASSIIFNPLFTDAEVTAILLHEIGHNFSTATITSIGVVSTLNNVILGLVTFGNYFLATSNFFRKGDIEFSKFIRTNARGLSDLWDLYVAVFSWVSDIWSEALLLIDWGTRLTFPVIYIVTSIVEYFKSLKLGIVYLPFNILAGYNDERFSDSFAAMYGYGVEQTSALEKLSNKGLKLFKASAVRDIPFFSNWMEFVALIPTIVITAFDPHPELPARFANTIRQLEYDLNTNAYSPKMKARLKHDLAIIKQNYAKLIEVSKDANAMYKDKNHIRKIYYKSLADVGGDNRHKFYTASNPENLNKSFFDFDVK